MKKEKETTFEMLIVKKKCKPSLMAIQLTQIEANLESPALERSLVGKSTKKLQLVFPSHLSWFSFQKNVSFDFFFLSNDNFFYKNKSNTGFEVLGPRQVPYILAYKPRFLGIFIFWVGGGLKRGSLFSKIMKSQNHELQLIDS